MSIKDWIIALSLAAFSIWIVLCLLDVVLYMVNWPHAKGNHWPMSGFLAWYRASKRLPGQCRHGRSWDEECEGCDCEARDHNQQ